MGIGGVVVSGGLGSGGDGERARVSLNRYAGGVRGGEECSW